MSPSVRDAVNEALNLRARSLQEFYGQIYYSCDNFPKYAGKLSGYFMENYPQGGIRDFTTSTE